MISASEKRVILLPPAIDARTLSDESFGSIAVVGSATRGGCVAARLSCPHFERAADVPPSVTTVVAVGGGRRLDEAKAWRAELRPAVRLIAVPTLFGSGADASPIAVLDAGGTKTIRVGPQYLPDARWVIPEFANDIPQHLAIAGCGDAWAHVLEGFLSPLADAPLRAAAADLMLEMLQLPLAADAAWFDASARACAVQVRSGVGLTHGIAHQLEAPLRQSQPAVGWGHANLCALFLVPVISFNLAGSNKIGTLFGQYGLEPDRILSHLRPLFDAERYVAVLPLLNAHWRQILRDPCTRVNSRAVRPGSLNYFTDEVLAA